MNNYSDTAIHVANLSKEFKIYSHPLDMVREILYGRPHHKSFWALRDVSFDVPRGQVVGIMGRNGAGKSTLLKIVSGTLDATAGEVKTNGRISSILELGTGFNAEYTGRENIYLGGLMVGLSREEIKAKEDWIIDFSELKDFIDQPFKTYSSGMQARLTFSTAVCIDPDILIVDEALSVGDGRFQTKCYSRIQHYRDQGGTILLVTHSDDTILRYCDQAILFEGGSILVTDTPKNVVSVYRDLLYGKKTAEHITRELATSKSKAYEYAEFEEQIENDDFDLSKPANSRQELLAWAMAKLRLQPPQELPGVSKRIGTRKAAELLDLCILDVKGERVTLLETGKRYRFKLVVLFYEDLDNYDFYFGIRNIHGVLVFETDSRWSTPTWNMPKAKAGDVMTGYLDVTMWLTNGTYYLSAGTFHWSDEDVIVDDTLVDYIQFTIDLHPMLYHLSMVNLEHEFNYKWEHKS